MSEFTWDNPEMRVICGECHFKDNNPELCHAVEPPMKKKFIPSDVSSCSFIRQSHWERMPKEKQDEIDSFIQERSQKYYQNNNIKH